MAEQRFDEVLIDVFPANDRATVEARRATLTQAGYRVSISEVGSAVEWQNRLGDGKNDSAGQQGMWMLTAVMP
jgi:hypothetical protein